MEQLSTHIADAVQAAEAFESAVEKVIDALPEPATPAPTATDLPGLLPPSDYRWGLGAVVFGIQVLVMVGVGFYHQRQRYIAASA